MLSSPPAMDGQIASRRYSRCPTKVHWRLRGMLEARLDHIHAKSIGFNGNLHNSSDFERRRVEYVVRGAGRVYPIRALPRVGGPLPRFPEFPVYHYLTVDVAESPNARLRDVEGEGPRILNS